MAQGTTKGVPIDIDGTLANNSDLLVASQKATKTYVDGGLLLKQNVIGYTPVNKGGDTMIGNLILNANPTLSLGAATKDYVDTLINGIDWKQSANAGTVASLPTYAVTGSGQILTGTTNGAIPSATTDDVTLVAGNRVLVKNETSTLAPNNGIYVVTQAGSGSLPFILTRASDANAPSELSEATLSVSSGSTLSNTQWHCNPASIPVVIGTTNITFAQIGSGTYTAGSGLTLTGNIFSVATNGVTDAMIQSATNWNTAYTNRITSLTTTGNSGAATLISNTLNIPNYTLAGLGGVSSNIYTADGTLTSARTLTSGGYSLTFTGSNTASSAIARGILMNHTLVAAANSDVLVGLDINPTFTNGAFTGVTNAGLRIIFSGTGTGVGNYLSIINNGTNPVINSGGIIAIYAQNAEVFYASTVQTIIKGRATTSQLNFGLGTTEFGRFHATTGNLALQNGGTYTDNNHRLQVTGTSYFSDSVGIGTSVIAGRRVSNRLSLTGATTAIAYEYEGNILSDVTSDARGFSSYIATSGTFTLPILRHFFAAAPSTFSATITNQYGFWADAGLIGATNNFGFYGNIASGSNRWNLYMNGTANNYMAGSLGIGSTSLGTQNLRLNKQITGATAYYNFRNDSQIQADVTAFATYSYAISSTAASTTINFVTLYEANQGTFGAGSTITNQVGFHAQTTLIGATNNYGFRGSIPSGSNRWNLYMDGTASNYLNGVLTIGTASPNASAKVQIDTTTKGFLPPRMTLAQRTAIASPAIGLLVYQTDTTEGVYQYTSAGWTLIGSGGSGGSSSASNLFNFYNFT